MASYKILIDNSTLGAKGTTVTTQDVEAAPANIDLLIASGIIEVTNKTTTKTESE
jgi:hypothetical protein